MTIPVEVGTEIGQQVGEAAVEKKAGIRPDADLLREGLSVIGPTFILSALTAGMAHPLNRIMFRRFETALSDSNTPREVRQQVVDSISSVLSDADPNLGAMWKVRGTVAVMDKEAIPLDADVSEWFKTPPKEGTAPTPTPPPVTTPTTPGIIPGREEIIQHPPEKITTGPAVNIEPGKASSTGSNRYASLASHEEWPLA